MDHSRNYIWPTGFAIGVLLALSMTRSMLMERGADSRLPRQTAQSLASTQGTPEKSPIKWEDISQHVGSVGSVDEQEPRPLEVESARRIAADMSESREPVLAMAPPGNGNANQQNTPSTAKGVDMPGWLKQLPAAAAKAPDALGAELSVRVREIYLAARTPRAVAEISTKEEEKPSTDTQEKDTPPKLIKQPDAATTSQTEERWPPPTALLAALEELGALAAADGNAQITRWAKQTRDEILLLGPAVLDGADRAKDVLQRIAALQQQAEPLAVRTANETLAHGLRKCGYSLGRRVDLWQPIVGMEPKQLYALSMTELDAQAMSELLSKVDAMLDNSSEGRAWRAFLEIEALRQCVSGKSKPDDAHARLLAREILERWEETPLTTAQQRFVGGGAPAALWAEVRQWAADPSSPLGLLRDIERFELTCLPGDARRVAMDCRCLETSPSELVNELAARAEMHYRNANFRLAVSEKLINDLMPEQGLEYAPVRDTVLTHPVRGESLMATETKVRMSPDAKRVRMILEVKGDIAAATTTDAGLARFHNNSNAFYIAEKPIEVDLQKISLGPVDVRVYNETRLKGVETPLDDFPLVGPMLKGAARSQLEQKQPAANREVRGKVAARARQRIDAEVHQQFSGFVERMNRRVFEPLNSLMLDPMLIGAETTAERFMMRVRLAGDDQLGGHTPRPRAPGDSLASVQVHESVINNGIQRLSLAGGAFTLPELTRHIAESLNCPEPWETNPENDDVKIIFAERDPVFVRCSDGQLELTLNIERLSKPPRKWKEFRVRAYYRPEIDGRHARLVRDGVIHLSGPQLTAGSQIALRGIFARVLSKNTPWELVPDRLADHPKLQDAAVTQLSINDGWIGFALGPKPKSAEKTARRPGRQQ
jgi:hypothetical protein